MATGWPIRLGLDWLVRLGLDWPVRLGLGWPVRLGLDWPVGLGLDWPVRPGLDWLVRLGLDWLVRLRHRLAGRTDIRTGWAPLFLVWPVQRETPEGTSNGGSYRSHTIPGSLKLPESVYFPRS